MASGGGNEISPAAALASGAKAGGKTYTQFYTEYTLLEGKLRATENEVSRLTQILDEISADLAEKVSLSFCVMYEGEDNELTILATITGRTASREGHSHRTLYRTCRPARHCHGI